MSRRRNCDTILSGCPVTARAHREAPRRSRRPKREAAQHVRATHSATRPDARRPTASGRRGVDATKRRGGGRPKHLGSRSVDAVTHLFRGRTFSALSHAKWMNGILELGCGKRQISSRCERCAALQAILYVDRMTTCCFFAFAQRTKIRDNWRQSSRVPIMLRTKKVVNTDAKRAASRKRAKAGSVFYGLSCGSVRLSFAQ